MGRHSKGYGEDVMLVEVLTSDSFHSHPLSSRYSNSKIINESYLMLHDLNSVNQFSHKSLGELFTIDKNFHLFRPFERKDVPRKCNLDHMKHRIKNEKVLFG